MNTRNQNILPLKKTFLTDPTIPYSSKRMMCTISALLGEFNCLRLHSQGKSSLGRSIPVITLGNGSRKVLFVGTIHGREHLATGYLLRCIEEFSLSLRRNTPYGGFCLRKLFENFTLYFVPLSNPDGADISLCLCKKPLGITSPCSLFKNNAQNINLNANFPFLFEKVPPHRQGGKYAASEAETKFLINLCESENFELMLSFHTRGGVVYFRDSFNKRVKCDEEIAEKLHAVCGLNIMNESRNEDDFSGGFENWFRYQYNKPAFCVELVTDESADFTESVRNFYEASDFIKTRLVIPAALSVIK